MQVSDLPVNHKIVSRLTDKGITELTDVQRETILPALLGKDIIASSKTGSGKTFAFLVPAVERLLTNKALSKQDPRALILAPTRELAKQVFLETKSLIQGLGLQCQLIVGGENYNDQVKALRRNPDILIGTAGRIADHLSDRSFFLNGLELLIFDEADRMFDLGFASQLSHINEAADHRKRQTMLFSATLDNIELNHMCNKLLRAPVRVAIGSSAEQHVDISQSLYFADSVEHKDTLLKACLAATEYNQAVVFTATREDTQRIADALNEANLDAVALRGDFLQNKRAQIMSEFSRGQQSILVTTDVASRGLDLRKVGLVVNYDMPKHAEEYIHRIGRTGRAGDKGVAISFVSKRDWRSFTAVNNHVAYSLNCEQHPDHPANFSGFEAAKPKAGQQRTKNNLDDQAANKNVADKPVKRINTMTGKDVGMRPVKKKRRPVEDIDDIDNDGNDDL